MKRWTFLILAGIMIASFSACTSDKCDSKANEGTVELQTQDENCESIIDTETQEDGLPEKKDYTSAAEKEGMAASTEDKEVKATEPTTSEFQGLQIDKEITLENQEGFHAAGV